jgi:hypothetical protein
MGGVPQCAVTGFARIADGPLPSFRVPGRDAPSSPPSIALDRAGEVHVGFRVVARSSARGASNR